MTFIEFLEKKKISVADMQVGLGEAYAALEKSYQQLGAQAFDQRKKFYINDWRLRFPIKSSEA